jgi:hypothetical protein
VTVNATGISKIGCLVFKEFKSAQFSVHTAGLVSEKAGEKYDLLDLTLEKYNIYT